MDNLAQKMKISHYTGWYDVSASTLKHHGGTGQYAAGWLLDTKYGGSITKLLTTVYPEYLSYSTTLHLLMYTWDIYRFSTKFPSGHWNSLANQRLFMDELAEKLNITDEKGWYKVSLAMMKKYGGLGLVNKYKFSMHKLLTTIYPKYRDNVFFIHRRKNVQ